MNDFANAQLLEDQRRFQRVEFLLVPDADAQLPVWIFKPQDLAEERAGVVLNISEGGLQIITGTLPPLPGLRFELTLLEGEEDALPHYRGWVRRVWRRAHSDRSELGGFEFETPNSLAEDYLASLSINVTPRHGVRCVLKPQPH